MQKVFLRMVVCCVFLVFSELSIIRGRAEETSSNDVSGVIKSNQQEQNNATGEAILDEAESEASIDKATEASETESVRQNEKGGENDPMTALVQQAWEASSKTDLERLKALVAQAHERFGKEARQQAASLEDFPARGKEGEYQAMNNLATILFVHAEALMNAGKKEEAIAAFQSIIDTYPYAQAWDPRGWYWSVAEKSQNSINVMMGKVDEDEPQEDVTPGFKTLPHLAFPGKKDIVDYTQYGEFQNVGTKEYRYKTNSPRKLNEAVGEGIYPNTGAVLKNPAYQQARKDGRLEGSHWDFVYSDDLEAAYFKWATAPEPWGIKLFYLGMIFEKAKMYHEAIKAYHAIVIHFPQTVGWTYWQTPWYPAQAAIAKIKHIIRMHPELNLRTQWMKVEVNNGFDNDISNDTIVTYPGVVRRSTWWDHTLARLSSWKEDLFPTPLGDVKRSLGQGKVRVVQYENGHWQLLVNGEPYVIKGITYAPTKVGQSPDKGTLVSWMKEDSNHNGKADGPFEAWVDKNENNTRDADEPVVGDFQLLKEMGLNTIREYHQPFEPDKELLRKMHREYGFRVILGDFLGKYTLGSGATWFEGTDYENPGHRKNMMASVRKMVLEHKDEDYLLMWLLGNENNYGVASNADKNPEAYFAFANDVAKMIKSLDPDHPVALCNGDTLFLDKFAEYAPDIDIFSANVYRGDYGFGSFWEQVFDATGKAAFITEFGAPAYAQLLTMEEAEEAQADYHRGNWLDIEANQAGTKEGIGNALGGVVFEWTDEWWKNYEPFYHDKRSDAIGPFPGGYYYEEWFGITSQGNGQHSPFMRQLRKSYFAYQEMWQSN